jgi:predicted PurR-regulated permease PerM
MADDDRTVTVRFEPSNVWRTGLVLLAVIALAAFLSFVINDGGNVIFTVLMAWFAAITIAPVVTWLSQWMRRGVATMLVIVAFAAFVVLFILAFGNLLVDQIVALALRIPDVLDQVMGWINARLGTDLDLPGLMDSFDIETADVASAAGQAALGLVGFLFTILGGFFSLFTFGLFLFYMSADMPRFERWIGSLFPPAWQPFVATVWRTTAQKTGGYMGARVVLAAINSATTAVVFVIIDMPYWLPLALWTGIVAQFVPTIGTYISIILPVLVGLVSANPWVGVIALIWAVLYQQIENLTIEPRISARAVDVNPAVSFGAVLLGAALFGVAGAFLAVPVAAMLLSLLDIYGKRFELLPDLVHTTTAQGTRRKRPRWSRRSHHSAQVEGAAAAEGESSAAPEPGADQQ